jgi:hypothetical protein
MHRKAVFALAGVFLAIAIVVPMVLLVLQADNDLDNLIIIQNPAGMQTNGNISSFNPQDIQESHEYTLIIVLVVEVVFISLFAVTVYYGIKHVHPYH